MEVDDDLHVERSVVPVGCDLVEELVVWDRDGVVVERLHANRTQADRRHVAVLPPEAHAVAHLKRSVEHDHDARDKRRDKVLHRKSNGDSHRATDHRERAVVEIEAQREHRDACRDIDDKLENGRDLLE